MSRLTKLIKKHSAPNKHAKNYISTRHRVNSTLFVSDPILMFRVNYQASDEVPKGWKMDTPLSLLIVY
jgi:hypothetical protein